MKQLERILVVVDRGMRVSAALRRGVELARRAAASLQLCLLDYNALIDATADIVDPEVMRLAKAQFLAERTAWLARECHALCAQGLRVGGEVRWAPTLHEAVLDRVLEHRPDLVIKDVDPDGARTSRWFTAPDWKLLRLCPTPLMLVQTGSTALPRRILATVDTSGTPAQKSPLNDAVTGLALRLGLYSDAEVHLAHVFPFQRPGPERLRGLETAYEDMRRSDAEQFQGFALRHRFDDDRRHLLVGDPAATIADFARDGQFDLLLAGSVYRSALDRFFLGSTVESMVARTDADVLVVKPPNFADALARHLDLAALRQRQALLQDGEPLHPAVPGP